jgi:hypothetical protein
MPAPNQKEYLREWRRSHPHYSRDHMRRVRHWTPGRHRVFILGVLCKVRWMPIPAVSKEQAEQDFEKLYPR